MAERTFGWVQEASRFGNLKRTVQVFVPGSPVNRELIADKIPRLVPSDAGRSEMLGLLGGDPVCIPYALLKGRGADAGKTRSTAPCSGIIQAALPGQRREYQGDWPADSYLRWAISLGFLEYDHDEDACSLNDAGLGFALSDDESAEETEALTVGLLGNPPVCRVLRLLDSCEDSGLTKFEIGRSLGFVGEAGFTSIPQGLLVEALSELSDRSEQNRLKRDTEGTSDKYARMICSWLMQMGWAKAGEKEVFSADGMASESLESWRITLDGKRAIRRMNGDSSYARIPKLVMWEMLATKAKGRDYLRTRRALLIEEMSRPRTLGHLLDRLHREGLDDDLPTIQDDIEGFERIGLNIVRDDRAETLCIADDVRGLRIPVSERAVAAKDEILAVKDQVRSQLTVLDHEYLSLIDLSFDGRADREFEFATADLFIEELGFDGSHLGGSRKPDACIHSGSRGVIIDNKAASRGYSLPIGHADEMCRYLGENQSRDEGRNSNRWWEVFGSSVNRFQFLFVSSKMTGGWKDRVENIVQREHVPGGAIAASDLLLKADMLKSGRLTHGEFLDQMIVSDRSA